MNRLLILAVIMLGGFVSSCGSLQDNSTPSCGYTHRYTHVFHVTSIKKTKIPNQAVVGVIIRDQMDASQNGIRFIYIFLPTLNIDFDPDQKPTIIRINALAKDSMLCEKNIFENNETGNKMIFDAVLVVPDENIAQKWEKWVKDNTVQILPPEN